MTCSVNHILSPLWADNSPACTRLVEGKFQGKSLFWSYSVNFTPDPVLPLFWVDAFFPADCVALFKNLGANNDAASLYRSGLNISVQPAWWRRFSGKYLFQRCVASWHLDDFPSALLSIFTRRTKLVFRGRWRGVNNHYQSGKSVIV